MSEIISQEFPNLLNSSDLRLMTNLGGVPPSSTAPIWPNGIPNQSANGSIRYSPESSGIAKGIEISLVPDSIN